MKTPDQILHFQARDAWRAWLQENHATQQEAWLAIMKKHVATPGISYDEAVEEGLCFGWIDGAAKSAESDFYLLRFSPRKRGSPWSMSNLKRVERLIAQGKMTESGMLKIKEAQENGEWEAAVRYEDISNLPGDLVQALGENPQAQANFDRYPPSQKKQLLYWISSAKTETTRHKRIRETIEMAANNRRLREKRSSNSSGA